MDALQARAVTPEELARLAPLVPRVVGLRHDVLTPLGRDLALLHANTLRRTVFIWASRDTPCSGSALDPHVAHQLRDNHHSHSVAPGIGLFFPGIRYTFMDNPKGWRIVNRVRNNCCTGRAIVLHPSEPPPDPSAPPGRRYLRYPPLAVVVQPDGCDCAALCGDLVPPGCVPILAETHQLAADTTAGRVTVQRTGIPLRLAYSVTGEQRRLGVNTHGLLPPSCQLPHPVPVPRAERVLRPQTTLPKGSASGTRLPL